MRHGFSRKRRRNRLETTRKMFRKNLKIKDVH